MEYRERVIDGKAYQVIHALILDDEDKVQIANYAHCENVQIELSSMEYLSAFPVIHNLIITGGIPTQEGFRALYNHKELQRLVLDYEETDSDEDGVDLTCFPNLQYVLSRSNLNIRGFENGRFPNLKIEVVNHYRDGKPIKVDCPDGMDILQKDSFWFVSFEISGAAGMRLVELLRPVAKVFTDRHFGERFSDNIDDLATIMICQNESIFKERRYISWKKRFADMRLIVPYEEFRKGNQAARIALCKQNIQAAVDYVRKKDKTFDADRFLAAVWDAFRTVYP